MARHTAEPFAHSRHISYIKNIILSICRIVMMYNSRGVIMQKNRSTIFIGARHKGQQLLLRVGVTLRWLAVYVTAYAHKNARPYILCERTPRDAIRRQLH